MILLIRKQPFHTSLKTPDETSIITATGKVGKCTLLRVRPLFAVCLCRPWLRHCPRVLYYNNNVQFYLCCVPHSHGIFKQTELNEGICTHLVAIDNFGMISYNISR